LAGRLAVRAGRAVGVTSDPSKLRDASKLYMPVGQRVAVIGGGLVGAELAEFFVERGREVIVLEEGETLAAEMAAPRRWRVLEDLRTHGVELVKKAIVTEIGEKQIFFSVAGTEDASEERSAEIDTVVIATGLHANDAAAKAYEGCAAEVRSLGDTSGITYIEGAIHDGFRAAVEL